MTSRAVEAAARLQAMLQDAGIEASRHASSMILLSGGRLLATLHVYPDECIARIYTPWKRENIAALERMKTILEEGCPGRVRVEEAPLHQG